MKNWIGFSASIIALSSSATFAASEVAPDTSKPCFPGAYYRKAVSSIDTWQGIEGIVTLPNPIYDESRLRADGRPLDNASLYIGGRAGEQEIDCGLSWEVVKEPDGRVSRVGKAFRPFWRNEQWASGEAIPEYYFAPGDTVRLRVETLSDGKLTMRIDLLDRAGGEEFKLLDTDGASTSVLPVAQAATNGSRAPFSTMPVDAISSLTVTMEAAYFGPGKLQEFKRVNAIDQFGNEGSDVKSTSATVVGAHWHQVWLLRDGKKIPFTPERFTDMRCPQPGHFQVKPLAHGGEEITITGALPTAPATGSAQ